MTCLPTWCRQGPRSQSLAQQRAGARGAILCSAAFPTSEFGGAWPQGVPVEIHMMDADPWGEEDRPAAEALVEEARTRSSSCTRGPVSVR
jgi:hypothetical protein